MEFRRMYWAIAALLLAATAGTPAAAQTSPTPEMRSQVDAIRSVCSADYTRLCLGVSPGGGRILACLQSHASQLSPDCAKAMPQAEHLKTEAERNGSMPK